MCHYHLVKWSFYISYLIQIEEYLSFLCSLYTLLLIMVFHCFLLLFLILLLFLHLYWLYQSYKCFCIILPSSGYLLPSGLWFRFVSLWESKNYYILSSVCLFLSSISLSFSDFWIASSTFVLVPVLVDHGLSSLSSPPSFLILFSIFSIFLCSLSISMVSALFVDQLLSSSIFH